jgi:subtilisin family serine protease
MLQIKSFIVAFLLLTSVSASAGVYRHASKPLPNRYIVVLNETVAPGQLRGLAHSLASAYEGRIIDVMESGILAFGVVMTEARARALMHHPAVSMVEEDEEVNLSDAPAAPFDFFSAASNLVATSEANNCPWNGAYYLCNFADDTYWHLDRLDNLGSIYSYKAYAYTSTGMGVRAYVVDTGVYGQHSEVVGRVEAGANMTVDPDIADAIIPKEEERPITLDASPANFPCNAWRTTEWATPGHGTGVASVLGGTTTGVAKNVTIVPVKVITCSGSSSKLAMARGLDWVYSDMATKSGRALVTMSAFVDTTFTNSGGIREDVQVCENGLGGYTPCVSAIESVINKLIKPKALGGMNIPVVVSANNRYDGECRTSPARMGYGNEVNFPSPYRTITVGGTMYVNGSYADKVWNCADTPQGCESLWVNSVTGYGLGSNFGPCVSMWAPAANIRVAGAAGPTSYRALGGASSGTSWSAPYVAGIVARLLERYPTLSSTDIWTALASRADQRGSSAPDLDPSAIVNRRLAYISPYE